MFKTCTKCGETKVVDLFPVAKRAKDGRDTRCKACACIAAALYRLNNPDKVKAIQKQWRLSNPEAALTRVVEWCRANPAKSRQYKTQWRNSNIERAREGERASRFKYHKEVLKRKREYAAANPHLGVKYAAQRRAQKLNATPSWADKSAIEAIYAECSAISKATGERYEVDHIIPLISPVVCGLHVHTNLRIIPMVANRSKANKLIDEVLA